MRTRSGSPAAITAGISSDRSYSGVLRVAAATLGRRRSVSRSARWKLSRRQHGGGRHALFSLTTGQFNSAFGWQSLTRLTTASFNTRVGAGTLALNNGDENTGTGAGALLLNSTGVANTAEGAFTLLYNTTGSGNSALGDRALLNNTTSSNNIAVSSFAGFNLTTEDNNIDIGNEGVAGDANTIRIGDPVVHDSVFLGGIVPMTPEAPNQVMLVDPSTGQLGSTDVASLPPGRAVGSAVRLQQRQHHHWRWRRCAVQPGTAYCRDSDQQNQQHDIYAE
jgi:hypothetical protein